ncbi:MAG: toxin ParE1/3/4 [Bradymonadia bacterium]
MSRYRLSKAAERDLLEIWDYAFSFQESVERADGLLRELEEAMRVLAANPSIGSRRSALGPGILTFAKRRYLIVYRVSDSGVDIVRITGAYDDLFRGLAHLCGWGAERRCGVATNTCAPGKILACLR